MVKEKLETKVKKAVLNIEAKVTDIYNVVKDLSLKLCHIIKDRRSYYDMLRGDDYLNWGKAK